tara:strand:- start:696 stop:830 length:135 start_codon:yes stop_codon:yes gene_type:complete
MATVLNDLKFVFVAVSTVLKDKMLWEKLPDPKAGKVGYGEIGKN